MGENTVPMVQFIYHDKLFTTPYVDRVLNDPTFPRFRQLPEDADARLTKLLSIWEDVRARLVAPIATTSAAGTFVGLPKTLRPVQAVAESVTEQDFVRRVLHEVLGFATENNRTLRAQDPVDEQIRPDVIVFGGDAAHRAAVKTADGATKKAAADARRFCADALIVLDVKRFSKGIGADEAAEPIEAQKERGKPRTPTKSALEDIDQMHRYLRACGKNWGVLTNGRSWRLMRLGRGLSHLRFDLVQFLETLRGRTCTDADRQVFGLFWYLFGQPAVGQGYLDDLERESEAETRRVREVLREQAHAAVTIVANGFLAMPQNKLPATPTQAELDHLRELALIVLYRLLFVLKAEAQNLLPMHDELGSKTLYAQHASTSAIFNSIGRISEHDRTRVSGGFNMLRDLFSLVDRGGDYDVPAYNGGLFDPEKHPELVSLALRDNVVFALLSKLIYLDDAAREPVPYADLDVRDFGDIYEGLLGQRLGEDMLDGKPVYVLRNERGEKKASGSYFTPDALVEQVVRRTLEPLFAGLGDNAAKILALRVVDPAMGSGHFLVKVVDVMAWHLTLRCDPPEPDAPRDNGPAEFAYWKRKVVENCIYGVDVNPMAVELSKVALWLHTAAKGKPLSFLDHHLKCGNALVGARLGRVQAPGLKSKRTKKGVTWEPVKVTETAPVAVAESTPNKKLKSAKGKAKVLAGQVALPFPIDTNLFSGILKSVRELLAKPSDKPSDVKEKSRAYAAEVETRLAAHRTLCDLWCAQWFFGEPDDTAMRVYDDPSGLYAKVKLLCGNTHDRARRDGLERLHEHAWLKRVAAARNDGYGPRLLRFFHWELEFPEVAFDEKGALRATFGFDAVVGNPPWDKIKPANRDYYGPFSDNVANTQGPSLDRLIAKLESARPELADGWKLYEARLNALTTFLSDAGEYRHQVALVEGKKTGGDPDLFRYFVERATQCARPGARIGLVVPCTLWQAEGCTGLRRLLFNNCTVESLFTFENYRKWAFQIDSRFKFTAFTVATSSPPGGHKFPAAFMLRNTRALEGSATERLISLSRVYVTATSPETLALLDVRHEFEARLVEKIHAALPALGSALSGWSAKYGTELHMTNDSWLFRSREWMKSRGFTQVVPVRTSDGTWTQTSEGPGVVAKLPQDVPMGGEYWIAASPDYYENRGYVKRDEDLDGQSTQFFVHPDDVGGDHRSRRILPLAYYTALYEGRMVHNFDHAQKRYMSGEGRRAKWEDVPMEEKRLLPRAFVSQHEAMTTNRLRLGFCDVTGATNERTTLAALLPGTCVAGNKVPSLRPKTDQATMLLASLLTSFTWDSLIRLRVSTTMNNLYLKQIPVPALPDIDSSTSAEIEGIVAKLSCTTPELADVWDSVFPDAPWTYSSAERDLVKRANLRANLDVIIANLYGLTVPEFAYILTTFPLLDRDQARLPGDSFVTEGDERSKRKGERWIAWAETDDGIVEMSARSFVTRDLALFTFMRKKGYPIPADLHAFYRDVVGFDPDGPLSRFRIGTMRDLEARVLAARAAGAIAYVPSSRGGAEDEEAEGAA